MKSQGTDKEQQRQDGLVAPDVEGPPTVEKTNIQVSTGLDHTETTQEGWMDLPQCWERSWVKTNLLNILNKDFFKAERKNKNTKLKKTDEFILFTQALLSLQ